MEIQMAKIEHLQTIVTLNKFVDYKNPDDFFEESIEKERVLVALEEGKVLGFLVYQTIWGNTPLLSLLKIHPDNQKQGIGRILLTQFEEDLKSNGYKDYVSSTTITNTGSQIFHKKMGFIEMGDLDMAFGKEKFYKKILS